MRLFSGIIIATALLLSTVAQAADYDQFLGEYAGHAEVENNGKISPRDMSVELEKNKKGFSLTWKSIIHKEDGRLKEKEYSINFLPTKRGGIYSSAMATNVFGNAVPLDPMKGDPYVWSRITGNVFTVFSLLIDEQGGYEMQQYNRTRVEGGLELEYLRIRNGEQLKSIKAFLEKK